jgi:3-methyl-2-oxobutanoate hydroxymethyltransferase
MLPQRIRKEGRYRIKGKSPEEREALLADASALADAGAFCIILELVEPSVAAEITAALPIPTIGIGSGLETDGQILVTYDLIGLSPWFRPSFVRPKLEIGAQILTAVREWASEVRRNKTKQSQAN